MANPRLDFVEVQSIILANDVDDFTTHYLHQIQHRPPSNAVILSS